MGQKRDEELTACGKHAVRALILLINMNQPPSRNRPEEEEKGDRLALGNPKVQYGASGLIIAKNTLAKVVNSVPETVFIA